MGESSIDSITSSRGGLIIDDLTVSMNRLDGQENGDDAQTRNRDGTFGPGNRFGRGRPRRLIERDYLAVISDRISLDDWKEVVEAALKASKQGEFRAIEWLSKHCLGSSKDETPLKSLAVIEERGFDAAKEITSLANARYEYQHCDEVKKLVQQAYENGRAEGRQYEREMANEEQPLTVEEMLEKYVNNPARVLSPEDRARNAGV